jgi:hypothetical protein
MRPPDSPGTHRPTSSGQPTPGAASKVSQRNWFTQVACGSHCLLTGHQWQGCTCLRCAKVRDEDHEALLEGCHLHCRYCGVVLGEQHDWVLEGCVIRCRRDGVIKEEAHLWQNGKCVRCGKIEEADNPFPMRDPMETVHTGSWTIH